MSPIPIFARPCLPAFESKPDEVWTPGDFADLGSRAAVDKTLQRLAAAGELRRIDRGLYDRPRTNNLTGRATVPDYRAVIRAVMRRDRARAVIDGMTAANDLGLTTAVPARIEVLVDARLKPIKLGTQEMPSNTLPLPDNFHRRKGRAMPVSTAITGHYAFGANQLQIMRALDKAVRTWKTIAD
ncbi:DUF6088 family protein [Mesorhizobium sp. M0227]|uniref:DUF6088 family protein n=1 Tax=Mesorhizobium sp. M0227 TaxID=2956922 RepID=UPI00333DC821